MKNVICYYRSYSFFTICIIPVSILAIDQFLEKNGPTIVYFTHHTYYLLQIIFIFAITCVITYLYIKWANKNYIKERKEEVNGSANAANNKIWTFVKLVYKMIQGIIIWFICMVGIFAYQVQYSAWAVRLQKVSNIFLVIMLISYLCWFIYLIDFEIKIKGDRSKFSCLRKFRLKVQRRIRYTGLKILYYFR
ncbi:hypothetical protein FOF72_06805 [Lactobacillus jensenii]|jgi:hypothetical protein|uniref:Uncharacterized protein n=1 Tax=Lactobacillus jensenii TaxID=109790 RepID=A0A5N1I2L0_LACJE|nr:hypothetical protein BUE77_00130 [Lactobacillus jensenii]KRM49297.1 hypothetical protein FC45_GL001005 [Lactobacillus jensenii DSM 20557]KAA9232837.1 hypothetical protein F6I36_08395 [Lactobacillus jensenii]KAA9256776.1 hypothetical protein F6I24_08205 [Lactobacillus jensenii]KAA9263337.1 hypothetical protein F6I21_08085 [Lactobacillus jensenii]